MGNACATLDPEAPSSRKSFPIVGALFCLRGNPSENLSWIVCTRKSPSLQWPITRRRTSAFSRSTRPVYKRRRRCTSETVARIPRRQQYDSQTPAPIVAPTLSIACVLRFRRRSSGHSRAVETIAQPLKSGSYFRAFAGPGRVHLVRGSWEESLRSSAAHILPGGCSRRCIPFVSGAGTVPVFLWRLGAHHMFVCVLRLQVGTTRSKATFGYKICCLLSRFFFSSFGLLDLLSTSQGELSTSCLS